MTFSMRGGGGGGGGVKLHFTKRYTETHIATGLHDVSLSVGSLVVLPNPVSAPGGVMKQDKSEGEI